MLSRHGPEGQKHIEAEGDAELRRHRFYVSQIGEKVLGTIVSLMH